MICPDRQLFEKKSKKLFFEAKSPLALAAKLITHENIGLFRLSGLWKIPPSIAGDGDRAF
tara:strand:+ start:170 stop:349 length:180 start_codon:yes stop_codon:yes gene_type:complete